MSWFNVAITASQDEILAAYYLLLSRCVKRDLTILT